MNVLAALMLAGLGAPFDTGDERPPHLLLILADDLGWRDAGFAGDTVLETPHLDALARRGTVFTEACASAPNCAPTRACLMTGCYTPRHGIYTVVDERHAPGSPYHEVLAATSRSELPPGAVTIAEHLRARGYATGMVGMWNLWRGRRGPSSPQGQGFTFSRQPKELGFENDRYVDGRGRHLTGVLAEECVGFIEAQEDAPWFLYFAPHAVHAPFEPRRDLLEKYRAKGAAHPGHAATVEALDEAVGTLVACLAHRGILERTLIVFTSDNGGDREFVAPLRGSKGSLYQGGLRVPLVVAGPGVQVGKRVPEPVLTMDLFATLLDAAGADHGVGDGVSLRSLLDGRMGWRREELYWHFPCYTGRYAPASAVRVGGWKLIEHFESGTVELFDLEHDPNELEDLVASEPARARELLKRLHDWQRSTNAPRPLANPAYDPQARHERGRRGGLKPRRKR